MVALKAERLVVMKAGKKAGRMAACWAEMLVHYLAENWAVK
jgi:hypothetical protein